MATTVDSDRKIESGPGREGKARLTRWRQALFAEAYALPLVWLAVVIFFAILPATTEQFTSERTYAVIFGVQSIPLILGIGVLIPMIGADFDVSTPQTLLLSSMVIGVLTVKHDVPMAVAIVAALLVGLVVGILNGFLCAVLGLDSFVVTLGTGSLIWGIALWISNSEIISGISPGLSDFFLRRIISLPLMFYAAIALTAVVWWWVRYMPSGRRLTYTGENRNVARLSGVSVTRIRIGAFCLAGVVAAFAGIVKTAQSGSADPSGTSNLLLAAFAAVFLGGTTITPGRFNAWGTAIATLFLGTGVTALQIIGLASWIQQVFFGAALVGGIMSARLAARRREAREEREALKELATDS